MKTQGQTIVLEDAKNISVAGFATVTYTDFSGTRIQIPMKLLVHLYEAARYDHERRGTDWRKFCDSLFENQ